MLPNLHVCMTLILNVLNLLTGTWFWVSIGIGHTARHEINSPPQDLEDVDGHNWDTYQWACLPFGLHEFWLD